MAEKTNGSEVILAHTDSPGVAHTIAEHLYYIHREFAVVAMQEYFQGRGWRTVRIWSDDSPQTPRDRCVYIQINRTMVRYQPA